MGILCGKVALVTGASKGIGAGIAKGLAAAGASVVVNYASSKEGAGRVVSEIVAQGGKAFPAQTLWRSAWSHRRWRGCCTLRRTSSAQ
jgi:3-oxoacyl-[acyl-carrier protein] reductase